MFWPGTEPKTFWCMGPETFWCFEPCSNQLSPVPGPNGASWCWGKMQSPRHAFPTPGLFCFLMTSNFQDGKEGPAVHTPRWLGMTIPAKDASHFYNVAWAPWDQTARLRWKNTSYNRNQKPEIRSGAGELGGTPHVFCVFGQCLKAPRVLGQGILVQMRNLSMV